MNSVRKRIVAILRKTLYALLIVSSGMGILALASFALPESATVKRSVVIDAPVEHVYRNVSDFHYWVYWSPWLARDPDIFIYPQGNVKRGLGARWCWKSNDRWLENGCIEITSATPTKEMVTCCVKQGRVVYQGRWHFEPTPAGTKVAWKITLQLDEQPITGRYMGLFAEQYIGSRLQSGLDDLRERVQNKGMNFW